MELSRIRPGVIVSSDVVNDQPGLPVMVMLGSGAEHFPDETPLEVRVDAKSGSLRKDTVFSALQLRAVDRSRLVDPKTKEAKYLCTLDSKTMERIDFALLFSMDLHHYVPLTD
jgi:mRNA-degrading endonuclease toxin of MazEF toxin-antitoxin module